MLDKKYHFMKWYFSTTLLPWCQILLLKRYYWKGRLPLLRTIHVNSFQKNFQLKQKCAVQKKTHIRSYHLQHISKHLPPKVRIIWLLWVQLYPAWAQHTSPDQLVAGLTDIFCHLIKALFRTGGWHKKQLVFDGFLTQPAPKKNHCLASSVMHKH